jgi:hypothetical protein
MHERALSARDLGYTRENMPSIRGWECRKHCTKECRRRVTVHAHAPCAALAYALARRGDDDLVPLTDGMWWSGGAWVRPVSAAAPACVADHTAPPRRGCGGHAEPSARRSRASADTRYGRPPLYRLAALLRRRGVGTGALGGGAAVPRGRRAGAAGGAGAKAPSWSRAWSARTPTL